MVITIYEEDQVIDSTSVNIPDDVEMALDVLFLGGNNQVHKKKEPLNSEFSETMSVSISTTGSDEDNSFAVPDTDDSIDLAKKSSTTGPSSCSVKRWLIIILYELYIISKFITAALIVFIVVAKVGSSLEKRAFLRAPSTMSLYNTSDVCAKRNNTSVPNIDFSTFPLSQDAHDDDYNVAFCGQCGYCSNPIDIGIQTETVKTLTTTSKKCALMSLTGGLKAVHKCLEKNVGFTKPCEDCWVENIKCTKTHCKFTCLLNEITGRGRGTNKVDGSLNDCLQCDERMCGPQFLKCSGSNRRRLGLPSDIGRVRENELCQSRDVDSNNVTTK
mgnify:CR=1 FL=1